MPGMHGGSNTDKEYAPHMWIGNHFISQAVKRVRVGKYLYRVGRTDKNKLVAERWPSAALECEAKLVPSAKIPKKVRVAVPPGAFARRQAEVADVEVMFNKSN